MSDRKLATIREIAEIKPIEGADMICAYRVDGWWVIDAIGKYQVGDKVVYLEIDSWVPTTIAPFLSGDKEPKEYDGIKGERLRTKRLKGQLSQGLLLPLSVLPHSLGYSFFASEGEDVTEWLGITKWERPETNAQLAGLTKGNFPWFLRKTDQERIQNLGRDFEHFKEDEEVFHVTEKLDGSSMTVFIKDGERGVCSRNLELKYDPNNAFWEAAENQLIFENMIYLKTDNIALQGELVGEGIQGNPYKLKGRKFFVFDAFDIDKQEYIDFSEFEPYFDTVPLIGAINMGGLDVTTEFILKIAEGKSQLADVPREGLVFVSTKNPAVSFKAISNAWLLKNKE